MAEKLIQKDNKNNIEIDFSIYENEPEQLFSLVQERLKTHNYEEAIEIQEKSIQLAIKKFGGENKIELAEFYNNYSYAIIQKLYFLYNNYYNYKIEKVNSNNYQEKGEKIERNADKIDEEKQVLKTNINEEEIENDDIMDDGNVAFINLNSANLILKEYLKKYDNIEPKTLEKKIINYYLQLSHNYCLLANLEKIFSNYIKANNYYKLSIGICKKYDDQFSRNLASLYFEQAQIMDLDPKNCLLLLYKSKLIMEYHLQKELDKGKVDIKFNIDEKNLDLNDLSNDDTRIFQNRELLEDIRIVKSLEQNNKIKDFVEIIKSLDQKIEDLNLEIKEYNSYILKKKEKKRKEGENTNNNCKNDGDNKDINESKKICNITFFKKKRIESSNGIDDLKIPEDINIKEKI